MEPSNSRDHTAMRITRKKSTHYSLSTSGAVVVLKETELKRLIDDAQHDCWKMREGEKNILGYAVKKYQAQLI
ncbi:hypothetical protein IGI04_019632 [Brassica rapa subsp. trilocularis]|uniref:Uncharacterized protein n=1 Tax=Brassica rapa subsp. trilocularis TaxID=1813537 RepID=A0ABQ7MGD9_BRACM|nr:hypothetical protein IGI04_019632 [Brassica rapa subsp. trilocularis]